MRAFIVKHTLTLLTTLLLAPFAALATRAADVPKAAARPNVLLIISDDQGHSDFGFTGNAVVKTPHLDRLAGESAVFRNFVVAAACSPSRAAIFTGREHLGTGVWGVPPRANLRRDEVLAGVLPAGRLPHATRRQTRLHSYPRIATVAPGLGRCVAD